MSAPTRAASCISKASRAGSTSLFARPKRTTAWCRSSPWCAPARTKSTGRESPIRRNWPTAFLPDPEDLFGYQGLIIGSVEAGYFTPVQQELIRQFVDRRGGGLLLLGGQFSMADGGWSASKLTDLFPTMLPTQIGTFHREADPRNGLTHTTAELAPAGVDSIITRVVDDPAANAAKWKSLPYLMDYEDPGTPKPGARRSRQYDHARRQEVAFADYGKLRPRPHCDHGDRGKLALADELATGRHRSRFVLAAASALAGFRYAGPRNRFGSRADAAGQRRR